GAAAIGGPHQRGTQPRHIAGCVNRAGDCAETDRADVVDGNAQSGKCSAAVGALEQTAQTAIGERTRLRKRVVVRSEIPDQWVPRIYLDIQNRSLRHNDSRGLGDARSDLGPTTAEVGALEKL